MDYKKYQFPKAEAIKDLAVTIEEIIKAWDVNIRIGINQPLFDASLTREYCKKLIKERIRVMEKYLDEPFK